MFVTKKHLSRRTVLRGVGATIALPLLDAMIPAQTALANTAAKATPRLAFVYFPHGAIMDRWSPSGVGRDFQVSPILKPLEKYRDHLTIVSGLRNKPAESSNPHGIMAGTWLGCTSPQDAGSTADAGVTADQLAARHIGQETTLPSIELAGEGGGNPCDKGKGCGYGSTISFRTPTQPLPMENNPRTVFYRLFGQGDTEAERRAIAAESRSILDLVGENAKSLQRDLGAADRTMLSDYLDSVREIERRIEMSAKNANADLKLPNAPLGVFEHFGEQLNMMFELIALAYQANLTRIANFMMAKEVSMRTYPNLGISEAFHPLSHHQNDVEKMNRLVQIQTYHTSLFARFVKRLADMPDGDGSMLDHSIILYGSAMSNSDLHNNDPLPAALIGRGYGRLKGGQHLKYPQDTPFANLLVTMLDRAGVPIESFGNSTATFGEV
jgi:Protein of unknown function (DUF1552)